MEESANKRKRPVYPGDITDEEAVRILKEKGIWEKLKDGKHTLRYIYSGIMEETHLELDEERAMLKETGKDYEAMDMPYVAFVLYPGIECFEDWHEEGNPEFAAMMRLMEDC